MIDLEPTTRRLVALKNDLKQADNPEQRVRRAAYETAQQRVFDAKSTTSEAKKHVDRLNQLWGAVLRAQDSARDVVDAHEALDELAAGASLPVKAPTLDNVDLSGRDADEKTDAAVRASYLDAAGILEEQIQACDAARASHERTLLAIIQAYRNINDRTCREIDDAIESLPALEEIHRQLVTDDLPRTRKDWLRTLLQQIDVDRREITRGLDRSTPSWPGCRSGTAPTFRSSRPTALTATCRSSGRWCWPSPGTTRWGWTCSTTKPRSKPPSAGCARAWNV